MLAHLLDRYGTAAPSLYERRPTGFPSVISRDRGIRRFCSAFAIDRRRELSRG
ncbi:hypothetical protein LA76x_3060 [Lysobacter antibioticus]|uniref:Uncharacterized protein n=1 Tax=Lysobacter antibioticus TaxID=84531 RepID=A0A0S2FCF5_LYSAN|nr:hypothetical protein LA76x_3060 [Lysobacter antibioticus]